MPYSAPVPSTSDARTLAQWFMQEAFAHRMPAVIKSSQASFDDVLLTVEPTRAWEWDVWANLLCIDPSRTRWCNGCLEAHGQWQGTHVVLTGVGIDKWVGA